MNTARSEIFHLYKLCIIFALFRYQPVKSQDFTFSDEHRNFEVNEGSDVSLICDRETLKDIYKDDKLFVEKSTLNASYNGYPHEKYVYTESNNSFKIKNISRSEDGKYICRDTGTRLNVQTLNLSVLYPPGKAPHCDACPGSLRYCNGEFQREVQFTCITEEGNPSVEIGLYMDELKYDENIIITNISDGDITKKKLSFTWYYSTSNINPELTCNVTQSKFSFKDSCSFKPVFLSLMFDVEIKPNNVTIIRGKNITLTCVSNESNVQEFNWTSIPGNLKYFVNGPTLIIYSYNGSLGGPRQIKCQGSYGGLSVTAVATINDVTTHTDEKPKAFIVFLCIVGPFTILICFVVYLYKQRSV